MKFCLSIDSDHDIENEKLNPSNQVESKNISTQVDYVALIMARGNEDDSKLQEYEEKIARYEEESRAKKSPALNRQTSLQNSMSSQVTFQDGESQCNYPIFVVPSLHIFVC